jgi:dTDP-4-amino-4,6-dideoxygalactose transaminase
MLTHSKGMDRIPFFDYPRLYLDRRGEFLSIFDQVASRGAFILQKELSDFEANLANFTSSPFAIGVANATDGLEIAWMSIGLKAGDEVICCSHTMLATASAIKMAGGTPVPVDIGDDGLIDPEAVSDAINSSTVGIMPTQLNGRTCNMSSIMALAAKHGLYVVEDAAQALGSRFKGQHAGTFGNASAISFFPAKVLGCFGDAGAVLTHSQDLYHKIYQLHDHGRDTNGEVMCWGRNSRLDNLQAAFLDFLLKDYSSVVERRRHLASLYNDRLSILDELTLPPPPDADSDHFDVFQNYELQADRRDLLREYLTSNGIGTLVQWGGKAVHQWERLGFAAVLPKTERFFQRCIMLPMNMFITDDDVHRICDVIHSFYRS